MNFAPVERFEFHGEFEVISINGLHFESHYIPEELLINILCFVDPKELLQLSVVCKKWCNIIKSDHFWSCLCKRFYPHKIKQLPWYIYYSYFTTNNYTNLLHNISGERRFDHWKINKNFGDKFIVESIPIGADPLPSDIKDFNGRTSCFATSFGTCRKIQVRHNVSFNVWNCLI